MNKIEQAILVKSKECQALRKGIKEIFDTFDKYSSIKDDEWYLELKAKFLGGK